ncbi:Sulfotransferase [Entamoeba marina]
MAEGFENIALYQPDTPNPYAAELLNDITFKFLWSVLLKEGVGILSHIDPSRKKEYSKYVAETKKYFDKGSPIQTGFIPMFAGINPLKISLFVSVPFLGQFAMKLLASVRMIKEIELTPEVQVTEVKKPLFIIGLPRSGTTFLHHLLGSATKARTVSMYQQLFPGTKTMDVETRRRLCEKVVGFINTSFGQACAIPRYEEYRKQFYKRDWQYAYDILRDVLKLDIIENDVKDDEYLCLKNIQHIAFMKNLLQTFPDGRFVWIHRDPVSTTRSMLYLFRQVQKICESDQGMDDIEWFNNNLLYMSTLAVKNAIAARESWIEEDNERSKQFYDVDFKKFVKDPFNTVKDIHEYFDLNFDEETQKNLLDTVNSGDPKKKHGSSKQDDGLMLLTEDHIRDEYKFYTDHFPTIFSNN